MSKKKIKLAIVGLGCCGRTYLEILSGFPQLNLISVVDPNIREIQNLPPDIKVYKSVHKLLEDGNIPDIGLICTPPAYHHTVAEPLIKSSVNLLIEKPLSVNLEKACQLMKIASKYNCLVMVSAKFRYYKSILKARDLISSGEIGKIHLLENVFSGKLDVRNHWRSDPLLAGGGIWMDNGPHSLDIIEALAGPIKKIFITSMENKQGTKVEDECQANVEHENGVLSKIRLSWNEKVCAPMVRCIGTKGEITINWEGLVLKHNGMEDIFEGRYNRWEAFSSFVKQFLFMYQSDTIAHYNDHGIQSLAWIQAAYQSYEDKRWKAILKP